MVLESSNVREVSENAKAKVEKLNSFVETLYYRIAALEKRLKNFENMKIRMEEEKRSEHDKIIMKQQMEEVNILISKREYTKALGLAKKLVFDHQNDKSALKLLTKIQKLYESHKRNIEQDEKQKEKVDKTLAEIGIKADETKAEKKKIS